MSIRKIQRLAALAFIALIHVYTVGDPDFWWHVRAGELFWKNGWISIEPFAYTRIGEPYLATQSWLADSIFYMMYSIGGATGIIFLRVLIALGIAWSLLKVDSKKMYPSILLVCFLAVALLPSMKDRPQLWTFLCFAGSFLAVVHRRYLTLIVIQFLWVNLHGGASLIAFGLLGASVLQNFYNDKKIDKAAIYTGIGMILAFLATPNFLQNIDYVRLLFTDKTTQFIREWAAADADTYIRETGIFWTVAIFTILRSRYKTLFSILTLCTFGYMSVSAERHIPLFLIASVGIAILQLQKFDTIVVSKNIKLGLSTVGVVCLLLFYSPYRNAIAKLGGRGFGTYEPYASAFDFVEDYALPGNMFNTYNIGGYALFRGHQVFVDGRNVDYGYDFLKKTFDAAQDAEIWKALEQEFDIAFAVVEHQFLEDDYPYTKHFEQRADWHMVYIDEYASIYMKVQKDTEEIIDAFGYTILRPENFLSMTVFQDVNQQDVTTLEKELLQQSRFAPKSATALLLLAQMYAVSNMPQEARTILKEAKRRQPERSEIEILRKNYEL
jgi:hypothetical protein